MIENRYFSDSVKATRMIEYIHTYRHPYIHKYIHANFVNSKYLDTKKRDNKRKPELYRAKNYYTRKTSKAK